jgi:hypothetical protein
MRSSIHGARSNRSAADAAKQFGLLDGRTHLVLASGHFVRVRKIDLSRLATSLRSRPKNTYAAVRFLLHRLSAD